MIEELPGTSVSEVARRLVSMRQESGVSALGRVLTLVIAGSGPLDESVVDAANTASNEHPMRVIVLLTSSEGEARLDAEIRVGADAGASEVVVLRAHGAASSGVESLVSGLLLPDAPVFVWWPSAAPSRPGIDALGRIARRRITDAAAHGAGSLSARAASYCAGDTDLSWTRLTRWRECLAAILDQPPFEPVLSAEVVGSDDSPSARLLAAWLELALGVPTRFVQQASESGLEWLQSVTLSRAQGDALIERISAGRALLRQPGQPTHEIVLPRLTLSECVAEELRSLDEDVMYGRVLRQLAAQTEKEQQS